MTTIENIPKDGEAFYAVVKIPARWKAYKTTSNEFKRGIKGRWQR